MSIASLVAPAVRRAALLAPFALAVAATGCADEDESGTLTINYQFGQGMASCADSNSATVRVTLNGMQFAEEACDDSGAITLPSVPARNYELLVEGVDSTGTTVRDNLGAVEGDEMIEVIGGSATVTDPPVVLTPTPATVRFQFILLDDSGVPYTPAATVPIKEFRTQAFRGGGNNLLLANDFVVDQLESATVDMPDPDRELAGDLLDFVSVGIIDQSDSTVSTETQAFMPPGDGRLVTVRVSCMGTTCSSEVEVMGGMIDPTGGDTDTDGATSG